MKVYVVIEGYEYTDYETGVKYNEFYDDAEHIHVTMTRSKAVDIINDLAERDAKDHFDGEEMDSFHMDYDEQESELYLLKRDEDYEYIVAVYKIIEKEVK